MCKNGLITHCSDSGCGFKCCSFGSGGHIVILPRELDGKLNVGHLKVIDDSYLGGMKVKCIAKECSTCDNGYKPIMCRSYPLWVKSVEYGKVYRSQKCPLSSDALKSHKKYVLEMFTQYMRETNKWVDAFLAGAWVDKYEEL